MQGEKTLAEICCERDIKESLYYKWRQAFLEQAPEIFADKRKAVVTSKDERIAELERIVCITRMKATSAKPEVCGTWLAP